MGDLYVVAPNTDKTATFREQIRKHRIPKAGLHTELWTAERVVEEHGHDIRWCPTLGWLVYDETRWRRDDTGEVTRRVKRTIRDMYAEAAQLDDDKRKALIDFARGCETARKINAIVDLVRTQPGVPILADRLDTNPWLLNVKNGTIDLRSGEFRDHRRDDCITKMAPVTFDPKAECPFWRRFLSDIFAGNDAMVRFVQRATGHAITGVLREEILHVLYGTGANGKTTFIETIQQMLGEYAMPAAPGLLLNRKNEQHPTERADLWGKRFVSSVEVGEGRSFNEELVKQLTGRDTIKGRFMHKDFFSFSPTHKILVSANHRPAIYGSDYAIWRRVQLWPFTVTFRDASEGIEPVKDRTLPERLATEWPGILAWAVEGCLAWQRDGLSPPECVLAATAAYRAESDTIGTFIEECCHVTSEARVAAGDLYMAYKTRAEQGGEYVLNQTRFGKAMAERGFEKKAHGESRRTHYFGVGLAWVEAKG